MKQDLLIIIEAGRWVNGVPYLLSLFLYPFELKKPDVIIMPFNFL